MNMCHVVQYIGIDLRICADRCIILACLCEYVLSGAEHSHVPPNMCEVVQNIRRSMPITCEMVQNIRKSLPIYSERPVNMCQTVHNDFIFTALYEYRSMYDG